MNPTGIPLSVKEFARDPLFSCSESFIKSVQSFKRDELLGSLFSRHMFVFFHFIFCVLLSAYSARERWRILQDHAL